MLPPGLTAIGYTQDTPQEAITHDTICIPEKHRLHAMILGSTGSGKSTTLKMLIRQNLIRGDGVAVLDPHHDLAAWTATRIPRHRMNQLVYISPAQLKRTGRAVPINPLEQYGSLPEQAAVAFTQTLLKAFDTEGARMQQILTAAATTVIASGRGGLDLLHRIILDQSERDNILAHVSIKDNLLFWSEVFPKMAKEAITAVDNKLTPIVSNPTVGPFFEGSTAFSMQKLIQGGGILIFDGAGCDNDIERTLFTMFLLTMLTSASAKLAEDRPQGITPKPFYLYVDEMQMLDSSKLKEMLQQVRKWGIRMTLATQQLESIDAKDAAAMLGNCNLCIVGTCTADTAKSVATKMGVKKTESLIRTPKFHMNFHMSKPDGDIHGSLVRTRDMDRATTTFDTLDEIVDWSIENYGVEVDMTRFTNDPGTTYEVAPLDIMILSILYHNHKGLSLDDMALAAQRYGAEKRTVAQRLEHQRREGMVEVFSTTQSTSYKLTTQCIDKYFDFAALKGRAGGNTHIAVLRTLADHYTRRGYYVRMDVGDTKQQMPDLEVVEPATGPLGMPDTDRWGNRVAVELETGPSRHPNRPGQPGQVYKNWKKSPGHTVWFLVFTENDAGHIRRQLSEMEVADDEYTISVICKQDVLDGLAIPVPPGFEPAKPLDFCGVTYDALQRDILRPLSKGSITAKSLREAIGASYTDKKVAEAIRELEKAGVVRWRVVKHQRVLEAV